MSGAVNSFPYRAWYMGTSGSYTVTLGVVNTLTGGATATCDAVVDVALALDCTDLDLSLDTVFPNGRLNPFLDEEVDFSWNVVFPT